MLLDRDLLCQVSLGIKIIITNSGDKNDNNNKILEYSGALAMDQNSIVPGTAKPFPSPVESETNKVTNARE